MLLFSFALAAVIVSNGTALSCFWTYVLQVPCIPLAIFCLATRSWLLVMSHESTLSILALLFAVVLEAVSRVLTSSACAVELDLNKQATTAPGERW